MKKVIGILAAVLLLGVLLFFAKEKGLFAKNGGPEGTPTPENTTPRVLQNVWIISSGENSITFLGEGEQQTLSTKGKVQGTLQNCVGDLTVKDGEILSLVLKPDKVSAKVLRADENGMELEGYGVLPLAEGFKVYRLYDGIGEEPTGKVLVGSKENEFILEDGKICAALLLEEPKIEKIRVLIGTEGYKGYYHEKVEVTADCGFTVSYGEKEQHFEKGEICTFSKETMKQGEERRVIAPDEPEGKITFRNLKRAGGPPSYRGTLEVEKREQGFLVVNEVTMEEYLYAVLPSEMPSDFGAEALKAQAICARSYAYMELMQNRYAQYGAHVDDSVACQVYNNTGETEQSVLAVKDTYGQVLFFEGDVAKCYYFSTSSGHTASAADVWENGEETAYLQGKQSTYDSESPWYRWQIFLPLAELEKDISDTLRARYAVVPEQILTYDAATDSFLSKPVGELGELKGIQVFERGTGGITTKLLVIGSRGVFLVKNEYNIRSVLSPAGQTIYRENGAETMGAALLPSAFVELQKGIYKEETGYLVKGGGYGHGVGMSQCGADAMAKAGYSCEEIMAEYYPGTELGFIYN